MKKLECKHNETKSIIVDEPFEGLNVSVVTEHDDFTTGVAVDAFIANPDDIRIRITNLVTNRLIGDMTLAEWFGVQRRGDHALVDALNYGANFLVLETGSGAGAGVNKKAMSEYSFPLPVYHGKYEIELIVDSTVFASAVDSNSIVTIIPKKSVEAMDAEYVFSDHTLDRKADSVSFNGAYAVCIMDKAILEAGAPSDLGLPNISQITLTAVEDSLNLTETQAYGVTASYCERPHEFEYPQLIVHSGFLLTNGTLAVEQSTVGSYKAYIVTAYDVKERSEASKLVTDATAMDTKARLNS